MEDIEEYKALSSTFSALYNFHQWQYDQLIKPRNIKFDSLLPQEQALLPWYTDHTEKLKQCIEDNKTFLQFVATSMADSMGVPADPSRWFEASFDDYDRVRSTLLQLAREWSDEGADERKVFGDIIGKLNEKHPVFEDRQYERVLVPGCGLGRLVYDLVLNGYQVHGNEFSYHMLIMSNFILNFCNYSFTIHPYIMNLSHVDCRRNQVRGVTVPNNIEHNPISSMRLKHPTVAFDSLMSISAGSFTDLFGPDDLQSNHGAPNEFRDSNHKAFGSVITCFFLDTASNIIEYLKTIKWCMKPEGLWLNLGPLLWHYEGDFSMMYVQRLDQQVPSVMKGLELSRDDIFGLVSDLGFRFCFGNGVTGREDTGDTVDTRGTVDEAVSESKISTIYASDPSSLSNFVFNCEFWGCTIKTE